jgi:Asp-tRNA(Asn)/Glu-tRNA(Gln) amidotransferase A subunit family amidase
MPVFQSSSGPCEPSGARTDLTSSSVAGLSEALAADRITATALARNCMDRITDVNPALRAVIAVCPDALDQAAASDAAWRGGPAP